MMIPAGLVSAGGELLGKGSLNIQEHKGFPKCLKLELSSKLNTQMKPSFSLRSPPATIFATPKGFKMIHL